MSGLYGLLCCPKCKGSLQRSGASLLCRACGQSFPIIGGVPVLFPDGSIPKIKHDHEPNTIDTYFPWVHRVVLQSLLDNQVVVEIGSGNRAIDDPCIIRTDVHLTPHVDVVCDAHALPFRDESVDFIFSLAVMEHLRNPFAAALEMGRVVKDGGYLYHECNFVFAYHGYPHHYFNASMQGMEQVFAPFELLRQGVAPYQMPGYALEMNLATYLQHSKIGEDPDSKRFRILLQAALADEVTKYDRFFTEEDAARVAAGTFWFGRRRDHADSSVIPEILFQAWLTDPSLQARFPNPFHLGTVDNLLLWARGEGRSTRPEIAHFLDQLIPFQKDACKPLERTAVRGFPTVEPRFGTVWDFPECSPPPRSAVPREISDNLYWKPFPDKGTQLQKAAWLIRYRGWKNGVREILGAILP